MVICWFHSTKKPAKKDGLIGIWCVCVFCVYVYIYNYIYYLYKYISVSVYVICVEGIVHPIFGAFDFN